MNYECGLFNTRSEKYYEIYICIKLKSELVENQNIDGCYKIFEIYTKKINLIEQKIINIYHIMSYCKNIIYYNWKKYYQKKINFSSINSCFYYLSFHYFFLCI